MPTKHWIDRSSESENVIIANESSLMIGSCDKEHYDSAEKQLQSGKPAAEVLGSDDLKIVPFSQLQSVVARDTDQDIDISYRAKKSVESESLNFEKQEHVTEFIAFIDPLMPDNLTKKVAQQSALVAAINPAISLVACFGVSYLFFNKLRIVTLIVGGIWALVSCYLLYTRISNPPEITRWTIKGKHGRKAWQGMKTAYSTGFLVLVMLAISFQIPDSHGEKALYSRAVSEMIVPGTVEKLLGRGADINYTDEEGDTALTYTLYYEDHKASQALVEAGADLSHEYDNRSMLEYAIDNNASLSVLEAMLERGALQKAELAGFDPTDYLEEYANEATVALFAKHRGVTQSGL